LIILDEYKDKIKLDAFLDNNYSYQKFLTDNEIIKNNDFGLFIKQKCFQLKLNNMSNGFNQMWLKTNINQFKNKEKNKK